MNVSRFHIRFACACGKTREIEALLAGPGGIAPVSCSCGRSFKVEQRDPAHVTRIAVDPLGVTGGAVPRDLELPKVH